MSIFFSQPGHIWDGFVFVLPCEVYETSPTPSHLAGRRMAARLGQCFGFRLQAPVLGCAFGCRFLWHVRCFLARIQDGERSLAWWRAGLGVVVDRAPSGWGVIAAGVSGAHSAAGFSSPWPVWGRMMFRFHKVGKFGVGSLEPCYPPSLVPSPTSEALYLRNQLYLLLQNGANHSLPFKK